MADGNPGGVINYRLENLAPGKHSVRLRVFDTSGNMAEREIEFNVSDDIAPRIFEVFTDANPPLLQPTSTCATTVPTTSLR